MPGPRPTIAVRRRRALAAWLSAVLVLVVGTAASAQVALARRGQFDDAQAERLNRQREQAVDVFSGAIDQAGSVVTDAASFVGASDTVSPDELKRYTASLQLAARYPGVTGLGVVVPVAWDDRVTAVERLRADVPEASLRTSTIPHELAMIVNATSGPEWVGLDVAVDADRRDALSRARDTGELAITAPTHKLSDVDKPPAERPWTYVMYSPIFRTGAPPATVEERRAALVGWTTSAVVVDNVVGLFASTGMEIAVLAGDQVRADRVLSSTRPFDALTGDRHVVSTTVHAGGQTWTLVMAPAAALESDSGASVVFVAGLIVSFAIACLLVQLGLQRDRLRLQVEEAVAGLEAANERLARQALHDSLTRLPNRALFEDRLGHAIERSRHTGEQHLVLFLDVDRFKSINDRYGHATGDQVLRTIAARLGTALRSSDTAARLGGDEFVVLCEHVANPIEARHLVERIEDAVNGPCTVDGVEIEVAVSVGYTLNAPGDRLSEILGAADAAMYRAKARRRADVVTAG